MTRKLRLLDAFCKAGGAGYGYHLAGFEVVGVDIEPQPRYPFEFHQGDALQFIADHGHEFDVIHTSPPCQAYSPLNYLHDKDYPDLIEPTRKALVATGKPYVIENVPQAPLINPITLCGTMFQLDTIRHRAFEVDPIIWFPPTPCQHEKPVVKHGRRPNRRTQYHGMTGHFPDVEWAREITGCHWMTQAELAEAIPPAYTEWLGKQLIAALEMVKE